MWRTLLVCALALISPLSGRAAEKPDAAQIVIRMTVKPMPAPKPALKYQLLPELREMNPGNPIQAYAKCFAEQHNFFFSKDVAEKRELWQKLPLKDLPVSEMQYYKTYRGRGPLGLADQAARLDTPDWQILIPLKNEGLHLLLPDVQQLRTLAGALKVRFRLELAEGRLDDAFVTAKTMLALSRHMGEHPSLIGELVAIAIASLTLETVDEFIQQPGCPNLFWALTDLPSPFIDLRKGSQADRLMLEKEFALLNEREPMTDEQLHKVIEHYSELIRGFGNTNAKELKKAETWMRERLGNEDYLRAARQRLIEYGLNEDAVAKFPKLQVFLLDQGREVKIWRDELNKALALPYWQASRILDAAPRLQIDTNYLFFGTLPIKVKHAQARLDQRLALLRCVEALRLYAAEHNDSLPEKLDDIPLPLPVDPATGKPFRYKVESGTAHLEGANLVIPVRYEVTIAK